MGAVILQKAFSSGQRRYIDDRCFRLYPSQNRYVSNFNLFRLRKNIIFCCRRQLNIIRCLACRSLSKNTALFILPKLSRLPLPQGRFPVAILKKISNPLLSPISKQSAISNLKPKIAHRPLFHRKNSINCCNFTQGSPLAKMSLAKETPAP